MQKSTKKSLNKDGNEVEAERPKAASILSCIDVDVYPFKVLFTHGFSYAEICKELKKQRCDEWLNAFQSGGTEDTMGKNTGWYAFGRYMFNEEKKRNVNYFFIVITDTFDFSDYDYCRLAHEVAHICHFCLPDFFDINREWEAYAYVHTYLMEQCLIRLRNKKL